MRATHEPAVHHRMRHFRVKLQRVTGTKAECLDGESVAFSQQFTSGRQIETFTVPLIDVVGPIRTDVASSLCRTDWIIADLGVALRMWIDLRTKMARHHLRTEANAEIWLFVTQRNADPVDLSPQEFFIVIGALRATEDSRAGMPFHRLGQRIAKSRPSNVERIAELCQRLADAAGR